MMWNTKQKKILYLHLLFYYFRLNRSTSNWQLFMTRIWIGKNQETFIIPRHKFYRAKNVHDYK